jgi:hypothetical protein
MEVCSYSPSVLDSEKRAIKDLFSHDFVLIKLSVSSLGKSMQQSSTSWPSMLISARRYGKGHGPVTAIYLACASMSSKYSSSFHGRILS